MANNTVKARIQLKSDTEENWNKAINFVPLKGELIIYLTDDAHPFSRLKVGDGTTTIIDLPFIKNESESNILFNTTAYWQDQATMIPRENLIIIYSDAGVASNGTKIPRIKIADGKAYLIDLPFLDEPFYSHINNSDIHINQNERINWNNKINCNDNIVNETLIFSRN